MSEWVREREESVGVWLRWGRRDEHLPYLQQYGLWKNTKTNIMYVWCPPHCVHAHISSYQWELFCSHMMTSSSALYQLDLSFFSFFLCNLLLFLLLLLHLLLICCFSLFRAIYLHHSLLAKLVFYFILLVVWHAWLFIAVPLVTKVWAKQFSSSSFPSHPSNSPIFVFFFSSPTVTSLTMQLPRWYTSSSVVTSSFQLFRWLLDTQREYWGTLWAKTTPLFLVQPSLCE